MTLLRLLSAFYNVSPSKTRIVLDDGKGNNVWSGFWAKKGGKKYLNLNVLDFEIDGLNENNFVKTLTVTVVGDICHG